MSPVLQCAVAVVVSVALLAIADTVSHRAATGMWPRRWLKPGVAEAHLVTLVAMVRAGEMTANDACEDYDNFTYGQCIYPRWKHDFIGRLFEAESEYAEEWFQAVRDGRPRYGHLNRKYPEFAWRETRQ